MSLHWTPISSEQSGLFFMVKLEFYCLKKSFIHPSAVSPLNFLPSLSRAAAVLISCSL